MFKPGRLGSVLLPNRVLRSATFEGLADENGRISEQELSELYLKLARNQVGGIITGFLYVNKEGRAVHPGQAGLDNDHNILPFKRITDKLHQTSCKIFAQLAHAGNQTTRRATGGYLWGVSRQSSPYFGGRPDVLSTTQVEDIAQDFASAAVRAQKAGFDGVQIHAAHGYLAHQFILPSINNRKDRFGVDPVSGIGTAFAGAVISGVRDRCGPEFPILFKISGGDDRAGIFTPEMLLRLVRFLSREKVAGIEISYGTMNRALNIFRGTSIPTRAILVHNHKYKTTGAGKRFLYENIVFPIVARGHKPFTPCYNLPYAREAKIAGGSPIISVGGFRSVRHIETALTLGNTDFVALSRPLLREPDLVMKWRENSAHRASCINCNQCAVMCDSPQPTKCYTITRDKQ